MISNAEEPYVPARVASARAECPALSLLIQALEDSPECFSVVVEGSHFEVAVQGRGDGRPNRGRLKVFTVKPGQMAAFFYKRSAVPFSRDRFSYGAVTFSPRDEDRQQVEGWLAYLISAFDWERAPTRLKRALTFDVPE